MRKTPLILTGIMVIVMLLTACNAAIPVANVVEPSATQTAAAESSAPAVEEATPVVANEPTEVTPAVISDTKDYLLHGQEDKYEAEKLHWSEAFLNQVDIQAVYDEYLASGGKADDVLSFAQYLTQNAPVSDNWKELFEADLLAQYDVTPSRYEALEDEYYQVYVTIDGEEVPYVGVNARTGYFHG